MGSDPDETWSSPRPNRGLTPTRHHGISLACLQGESHSCADSPACCIQKSELAALRVQVGDARGPLRYCELAPAEVHVYLLKYAVAK